jgi:hypothetical protein
MSNVAEATVDETEVELTAEQKAEAEELAGFQAEIDGTELPKTDEVKEESQEVVQDETTVDAEKEAAPVAEKVEPALAKVTEDQFKELLATATTVKELTDGLKKLEGKAFGKIGELERVLKQAEKSAESGLDIKLSDEDFAEVDQEVPMLTKPLQKLVNKILKEAKVKVPAFEPVDLESIRNQFKEESEARIKEVQVESYKTLPTSLLTYAHRDWKETVASQDFQAWLQEEDKLTPGYQNMFNQSWDATEIGGVLTKFKAHIDKAKKAKSDTPPSKSTSKATPPSNNRVERLKEAIPPKASSVTPKPKGPETEEDGFASVT